MHWPGAGEKREVYRTAWLAKCLGGISAMAVSQEPPKWNQLHFFTYFPWVAGGSGGSATMHGPAFQRRGVPGCLHLLRAVRVKIGRSDQC